MYHKKIVKILKSVYRLEYNSLKKNEIEISCSSYQKEIFKIEMGRLYNFCSVAVYIEESCEVKQKTQARREIGS